MDEITKYTKLWALPQGYGNNYDHSYWKEIVETLYEAMKMSEGDHLLDVGGGDQRLAKFFPKQRYTSLDIAPNVMEPGENAYPHIVADISKYTVVEPHDWAISIDVMEHIPTDLVDAALDNIAGAAHCGAAFLISTRPDRGGKKIGAVLHMTVREPQWWVSIMKDYWDDVNLLRVVTGEYCLIVCRHVR